MKNEKIIHAHQRSLQAWSDLCSGKEEGMFELYDMFGAKLLAFGQKRGNSELAKDALQDTFAALWKSRFQLGETDSPKNYLFATYRRKLVQVLGDSKKYTEGSADDFELPPVQHADTDQSERLKAAINKLSAQQKEVIYLKYYQGMDYEEIADILNMNYQSARNLMSRAIKSMRTKLSMFFF